ncbi:regulator of chromosome condensation 1/beta-lactamase-inhibitor protein II [Apodospora peruviana]|uniref:Regulator of chromosome condensation 1/beta-lactamase-inhibitor protein II n=1 Tax=Apodospora peruviana TaxID=516989 RepID=A0AAE0I0Y3_9PEZI|nr:regulator of chromosome condensation 1/beta-lactamase-inhibitor protein II [Apodospora peruviana]
MAPTTSRTRGAAAKAVEEKPAAPVKKAAAPVKKVAPVKKATEDSDKENAGAPVAKAKGVKRKRVTKTPEPEAEVEQVEESAQEEEEVDEAEDADAEQTATKTAGTKRGRTKKSAEPPAKKQKKEPAPKKPAAPKKVAAPRVARAQKEINQPPTQVMDIFVFGEGSSGELGLGAVKVDGKKPIDVKRPRINHNLNGVVQVACGGMHVAVLTKENKILTWGVNDQGALGRDTTWEGGLRDVDEEGSDSDDDDDTGLNPRESTPAEIDTSTLPDGITWVQVVASDSATFALTTTGQIYGWGTFRSNEGILGFNRTVLIQKAPILVPEINKIVQLSAGSNHILALDEKNKIYAWGAGQQAQLARRLLERDDSAALFPTGIGALPKRAKAEKLACGSYHCFVLDTKGRVIGWGLNNYAELGVRAEAGSDGGYIMKPQMIESLADYEITSIAGGEHHSVACTEDGKLLTWGRIDGHQVGQPKETFNEDNTIYDDRSNPRILVEPTVVAGLEDVVQVAAGTDNSFAITSEGKVYSWGFSANYQTGQGKTDDIETPILIDNSAIRGRKIIFAGAGGQYSVLGALPA